MDVESKRVECAIVIVNYNGEELLETFLPSVLDAVEHASVRTRLYVVDNASADQSSSVLQSKFPSVRVLANKTNRFWAGGNNDGAHLALRECPELKWLVFLNNDVVVPRDFVEHIIAAPRDLPEVGIVGVKAVFWHRFVPVTVWHGLQEDGDDRRGTLGLKVEGLANREASRIRSEFPGNLDKDWTVDRTGTLMVPVAPNQERFSICLSHRGDFSGRVFAHVETPSRHWSARLGVNQKESVEVEVGSDDTVTLVNNAGSWVDLGSGETGDIGFDKRDEGQFDVPRLVDAVCGVAMAIRTDIFQELDGFDETYGLYFEDTDFAIRAALRGYRCWYNPEATIQHLHSATSRAGSDFWRRQVVRSSTIFRKRFQSRATTAVMTRELRDRSSREPIVAEMQDELLELAQNIDSMGQPAVLSGRALV